MIAVRPRQGDIVRPLRLDIVEVFALVIDFVGRLLLRGRDIIGDRIGRERSPQRDAYP